VLVEIAARLRRVVRDGDTVARFSAPTSSWRSCPTSISCRIATTSCSACSPRWRHRSTSRAARFSPRERRHQRVPDRRDVAETLLRNAEAAMQRAKRSGPGGAQFYTTEMSAELRRLAELEAQLSGALAAGS
jgi:hypothetical protein